jgi:hypothetical protein
MISQRLQVLANQEFVAMIVKEGFSNCLRFSSDMAVGRFAGTYGGVFYSGRLPGIFPELQDARDYQVTAFTQ